MKDKKIEMNCKTPIEDLRREALKHYRDLANKCCDWNSFVVKCIREYNPSPKVGKEKFKDRPNPQDVNPYDSKARKRTRKTI